jgi:hypothetical protein
MQSIRFVGMRKPDTLLLMKISENNNFLNNMCMEIINIEAQTFEAMLSAVERFVRQMEHLCHLHGDRDSIEWMDNQDVCLLLNISPRTLQTLRDNGTLACTQICHKTYYKPDDVKKILPVVEEKRKQAKYKGKQI